MDTQSKSIKEKSIQLEAMIEHSKCRLDSLFSPEKLGGIRVEAMSSIKKVEAGNLSIGVTTSMKEEVSLESISKKVTAAGEQGNSGLNERNSTLIESIPCARKNSSACSIDEGKDVGVLNVPIELYNEFKCKGDDKPIAGMEKNDVVTNCKKGVRCYSQEGKYPTGTLNHGAGLEMRELSNGAHTKDITNESIYPTVNSSVMLSARSNTELKYIPFDRKNAIPVIELDADANAVGKWKNCLVGYFLSSKLPNHLVKEEVIKLWGKEGMLKIASTNKGIYFFEFADEECRDRILDNGFVYIFGKTLILKKWHLMMSLTKEALEKIPIWVNFYNLPYEFWSVDNLSKIASIIGKPLYIDQATEKLLRVSYARVCIEVDASDEKIKTIIVMNNDKSVEVEVDYHWYPARCCECKMFGHNFNACPSKMDMNHPRPTHGKGELQTRDKMIPITNVEDTRVNDCITNDKDESIHKPINASRIQNFNKRDEVWHGGRRHKGKNQQWNPVNRPLKLGSKSKESKPKKESVLLDNSFNCLQSGDTKITVSNQRDKGDSTIKATGIGSCFEKFQSDVPTMVCSSGSLAKNLSKRSHTLDQPKSYVDVLKGNEDEVSSHVGVNDLCDFGKKENNTTLVSNQEIFESVPTSVVVKDDKSREAIDRLYMLQKLNFADFGKEDMGISDGGIGPCCDVKDIAGSEVLGCKQNEAHKSIAKDTNPELDKLISEAFHSKDQVDLDNVSNNESVMSTPTPKKGLSFSDYPKSWSKKRVKKEMRAVKLALKGNANPP